MNNYSPYKKSLIKELVELYKKSKDKIIILLVVIIIVLLYSLVANKTVIPTEIVIEDTKIATTTKNKTEENNESAIMPVYKDNSRIKDDYIIDTDAVKVLIIALHEKATINPQFLCKDILIAEESHNNIYYYVLAEYNKLNNKYGVYKKTINYIREDIDNINNELQFVLSECKKRGFHIK